VADGKKVSIGLWQKLCCDAKVILDIGANSGLYSLVAKAVIPTLMYTHLSPLDALRKAFKKQQNQ